MTSIDTGAVGATKAAGTTVRGRMRALAVATFAFVLSLGLVAGPAAAQTPLRITVTPGSAFQPMPIAVPTFAGDPALAQQISQVIAADMKASGYFSVLDPASYLERSVGADVTPNFNNWKGIGAQAVIAGTVSHSGGQVVVQVRVWDVFAGTQLVGSQFSTPADNIRRVAHIAADAAYSQLTGFKGFFDSRIAFVDESGPKTNRVKKLAIMDWDGANVRYLTRGQELAFLDIDRLARLRHGVDEVGLAAQKGRRLQHIDHRRHSGDVGFRVHIGEHRHTEIALDLGQDLEPLGHAGAAKAGAAGAVGLVVAALEDEGDAQGLGHLLELAGHVHLELGAFDHAGAGDQEKGPVQSDFEAAKLHGVPRVLRWGRGAQAGWRWARRARAAAM